MYLVRRGLANRHLSLADRATPRFGPEGKAPSSSPTSSSAAARGVYGSADMAGIGGLSMSSKAGVTAYRNADGFGRRKK